MNHRLIDLAERLERMTRLDPALGEEARAALLAHAPGVELSANPLLDLDACNSLVGAMLATADVVVSYRINVDGSVFLVAVRRNGGAVSSSSNLSQCAALLSALCRSAAGQ